MSDGSIFVNYSSVQSVEDDLNSLTQQVSSVLTNVENTANSLKANWLGSSQDAYTQLQNKWNSDLADMQNIFSKYGPTLGDMGNNMKSTDNNLANQWSGLA